MGRAVRRFRHVANLVLRVPYDGCRRALEAVRRGWKDIDLTDDDVVVRLKRKEDVTKIVELLDTRQIAFDDLEIKPPSLEDVFLELTETD